MAQKRMFSKSIIESDPFLEMQLSTQALYFHLGMQADDDGFVSPNRVMRMINANLDDLKVLVAKKFIIPFESGVVVVKDWRINNEIKNDRKKKTLYLKELSYLSQEKNGEYIMDPKWIQNVSIDKISTVENRLGEISCPPSVDQIDPNFGPNHLNENGSEKLEETEFDKFWKTYPRKTGKGKAKQIFLKLKKSLFPKIISAVEIAKNCKQWQNPQFIPLPATWLYQERWDDEEESKDPKNLEQEVKALIAEYPGNAWRASNVFKERHKDMDINGPLKPYMLMFPLE